MYISSSMLPNMSIPHMPFPVLISTVIRSRSQVKPATLLIPIYLFLVHWWKFYSARCKSGSVPFCNAGIIFSLPA
jgi:hypothetical protein